MGVGDERAPAPWLNIDAYLGVKPDLCADLRHLPFRDGSIEMAYAGHVLEHLELDELPAVLAELRRITGRVCVVGPDCDREVDDDVLADLMRYGGDRWPGDRHLWRSTASTTRALLEEFFVVREVDVTTLDEEWPCPHRHATWQFALICSPMDA